MDEKVGLFGWLTFYICRLNPHATKRPYQYTRGRIFKFAQLASLPMLPEHYSAGWKFSSRGSFILIKSPIHMKELCRQERAPGACLGINLRPGIFFFLEKGRGREREEEMRGGPDHRIARGRNPSCASTFITWVVFRQASFKGQFQFFLWTTLPIKTQVPWTQPLLL